MRIYYLIDPELGWDNVCAAGRTIREMAEDYYESDDLSNLTDAEIENKISKDDKTYSHIELKDKT